MSRGDGGFIRVQLGPFDLPLCELDSRHIWPLIEADGRLEFWSQGVVVKCDEWPEFVVSSWNERQARYKLTHPRIVDQHSGLGLVLSG